MEPEIKVELKLLKNEVYFMLDILGVAKSDFKEADDKYKVFVNKKNFDNQAKLTAHLNFPKRSAEGSINKLMAYNFFRVIKRENDKYDFRYYVTVDRNRIKKEVHRTVLDIVDIDISIIYTVPNTFYYEKIILNLPRVKWRVEEEAIRKREKAKKLEREKAREKAIKEKLWENKRKAELASVERAGQLIAREKELAQLKKSAQLKALKEFQRSAEEARRKKLLPPLRSRKEIKEASRIARKKALMDNDLKSSEGRAVKKNDTVYYSKIRNAKDTSFKRCNNCLNLNRKNMCAKHKVEVSPNNVCDKFYAPKTYLGGAFSPR
ncbi:cell envelope integrity protein TolA [Domibacillus sp.]|uniref:cell envelope integrity protein TolA n=1 Tax=Domibacillus sp. TaxID=1969783 RepID=UPI002810DC21|nr:cell envelope integrity protein TolA [Domibacillus sp.]